MDMLAARRNLSAGMYCLYIITGRPERCTESAFAAKLSSQKSSSKNGSTTIGTLECGRWPRRRRWPIDNWELWSKHTIWGWWVFSSFFFMKNLSWVDVNNFSTHSSTSDRRVDPYSNAASYGPTSCFLADSGWCQRRTLDIIIASVR